MMAFVKASGGILVPANEETGENMERYRLGDLLRSNFAKARNGQFHRKFFALLDVGYDSGEPEAIVTDWGIPQKNREQFRSQVIIMAGFYETVFSLQGKFRVVPKSISFSKMEEHEFSKLYSEVANVILERVLTNYTKADLDNRVQQVLSFV